MDAFTYLESVTANWRLIAAALIVVLVVYWLVILTLKLQNRRYLSHRKTVWLEVTPPASIEKTPEATEQLFSVLHGLRAARQTKDKLLNRSPVMSFEIVSTRKDGIRYLMQIDKEQSQQIQKIISSYVPNSKVHEIAYSAPAGKTIEFKQSGHYVLPLTLTSMIVQHDPLSYITGTMTKLSNNEHITLQLVATPVKLREASVLSYRILGNENILQQVSGKQLFILGRFAKLLNGFTSGLASLTSEVHMGTTYGYKNYYESKAKQRQSQPLDSKRDQPSRTLSAFELELMETMHHKVTQPLFKVNLRIIVKSDDPKEHISSLRSALDGFSVPPYQSLRSKAQLPLLSGIHEQLAERRLPSLFQRNSMILAASEIASLYHFPSSRISQTDNMITSLSRTLAAPVSLKQDRELAVIIGSNEHHGTSTLIGLSEQERERHMYVIGGTGNGKTTMLQYQIVQDMQNGKGVGVVDPHGDMAETLLRHVPENRISDVIYFNPNDFEYPIGVNMLELTPGLTGNELLHEKDIITESVVSIFRKIFSDEGTGGHRIEYVLRNTIQTALTLPDATLFTIFDLLNDTKYRKSIVRTLEDKNLVNFWKNELGKAGDMQKVKMAAGITAKIGRFLFSASAKQILEQPKSTIDFEDIIDHKKIFICNFSKGMLGEDTSELFGIMVLAKLQLASLRRARMAQSEREPFYLYVDEFQNFATQSFVQMLSESRKYKLFMIMAEQSTSQQQDQQMVNIILANVGTVICFRTGNPQDERSLLPLFSPYIEQGEIANLPAFNFYAKLSAIKAQEPLSGQTILIGNDGSSATAEISVQNTRKIYGRKLKPIEKPVRTGQRQQDSDKKPVIEKLPVRVPGG